MEHFDSFFKTFLIEQEAVYLKLGDPGLYQYLKQKVSENGYLGAMLFARIFFPRIFYKEFGLIHEELFKRFVEGDRKELVAFPRGHGKTTIIRVLILWVAYTKFVSYLVYCGDTAEKMAKQFAWIKNEIESNRMLKNVFGSLYNKDKWTGSELMTSTGVKLTIMSRGKSLRGLLDDRRPELLLFDDLEDEESVNTKDMRDKVDSWLHNNAIPAIDLDIGRVFMVGTMIHEDCVLKRLSESGNWHTVIYGCMLDEGTPEERSTCPEMFSTQMLQATRAELFKSKPAPKHQTWYQEWMNQPSNQVQRGWRMDQFKEWEGFYQDGCIHNGSSIIPVTTFTGMDIASARSGSDFASVVSWAIDKEYNWYFLEYWRAVNFKNTEVIDNIFDHYKRYDTHELFIELIACQDLIMDAYDDRASKEPSAPIINEIRKRTQRKTDRIRGAMESKIHAGRLYLRKGMSQDLYIEFEQFPKPAHDDLLDPTADILKNGYFIDREEIIEKRVDIHPAFIENHYDTKGSNNPSRRTINW